MSSHALKVLTSSKRSDWATPQAFFDAVNAAYHFTLDVCAVPNTAKCQRFFSPQDNALVQSWANDLCWMNPPYGAGLIAPFIEKAYTESLAGAMVVGLVKGATDTRWYQNWIANKASHIFCVAGRVHFDDAGPAPFCSHLVFWNLPRIEFDLNGFWMY